MCWDWPSFSLSRRDGDSNRFQPARNLFLTQTQAYHAKAALGHLWYNSGPHFAGSPNAAQSGADGSQVAQAMPTHGPELGRSGHACPWSIDPLLAHPYFHPECAL